MKHYILAILLALICIGAKSQTKGPKGDCPWRTDAAA